MNVHIIPMFEDNYSYLVVDSGSKRAAVVDPAEPEVVISAIEKIQAESYDSSLKLVAILNTHHHWDHAGGNAKFVQLASSSSASSLSSFVKDTNGSSPVVYGADDCVPLLLNKVKDGDTFTIGSINVKALFTPCHTSGSVSYVMTHDSVPESNISLTWKGSMVLQEKQCVFTGDTLFIGGCGRFFEGTPEQMYNSLVRVLGSLDPSTHVYCGHEYTVNNLKYGLHVEPNNTHIKEYLEKAKKLRESNLVTVPSSISDEFLINPFVRVGDNSALKHFATLFNINEDPIEAMKHLRSTKDSFKPK